MKKNMGEKTMITRNENGRFIKVPDAKFFDGQIVQKSIKHYAGAGIVIVIKPTWSKVRGWVYGEEFCHIDNGNIVARGGYSYWVEEEKFESLTYPGHILLAEKYYREKEKIKLQNRLLIIEEELKNINFSLNLVDFPAENKVEGIE